MTIALTDLLDLADRYDESNWYGPALPWIAGLALGAGQTAVEDPPMFLEIGVRLGASTRALLQAAELVDGRLFSVDVDDWEGSIPVGQRKRWRFWRGASQKVLPELAEHRFSFIYIDGEHTYDAVVSDLLHADELTAARAIVLVDDCGPDFPPVRNAFEDFTTRRRHRKLLVPYGRPQSYGGTARTFGLILYGE